MLIRDGRGSAVVGKGEAHLPPPWPGLSPARRAGLARGGFPLGRPRERPAAGPRHQELPPAAADRRRCHRPHVRLQRRPRAALGLVVRAAAPPARRPPAGTTRPSGPRAADLPHLRRPAAPGAARPRPIPEGMSKRRRCCRRRRGRDRGRGRDRDRDRDHLRPPRAPPRRAALRLPGTNRRLRPGRAGLRHPALPACLCRTESGFVSASSGPRRLRRPAWRAGGTWPRAPPCQPVPLRRAGARVLGRVETLGCRRQAQAARRAGPPRRTTGAAAVCCAVIPTTLQVHDGHSRPSLRQRGEGN